ncbi:hypothetical protein Y032_0010g1074 [Ancylostoma ceylanicum]|nr:hypothetical protein Y032_0010g1074 [Ancylostoma ceylanicum]
MLGVDLGNAMGFSADVLSIWQSNMVRHFIPRRSLNHQWNLRGALCFALLFPDVLCVYLAFTRIPISLRRTVISCNLPEAEPEFSTADGIYYQPNEDLEKSLPSVQVNKKSFISFVALHFTLVYKQYSI